jgi:hypothetical protein
MLYLVGWYHKNKQQGVVVTVLEHSAENAFRKGVQGL